MADDNVNVDVQETQSETVDTVQTETPELNLGKFKTVDDLKAGYDNLEKMALKDHQKMKQLEKMVSAVTEVPTTNQSGREDGELSEIEQTLFWQNAGKNPKKTLAPLIEEVVQRYVNPIQQETRNNLYLAELNRLNQTYGDVSEVSPVMQEIIEDMGIVPSVRNLERIYNLAKTEINKASGNVAKQNREVLAGQIAKEKTGAVVETGTAASGSDKEMTPSQKLELEIEEAKRLVAEGKYKSDRPGARGNKVAELELKKAGIVFDS